MRCFVVPPNIKIYEDEVNEIVAKDAKGVDVELNFVEWLVNNVTRDKAFGIDLDKLEARIRIKNAMLRINDGADGTRKAKPGDVIKLESGDWQILVGVLTKPSEGFNPLFASQCLTFIRTIKDAKEE